MDDEDLRASRRRRKDKRSNVLLLSFSFLALTHEKPSRSDTSMCLLVCTFALITGPFPPSQEKREKHVSFFLGWFLRRAKLFLSVSFLLFFNASLALWFLLSKQASEREKERR
jgi:hypothetical protein